MTKTIATAPPSPLAPHKPAGPSARLASVVQQFEGMLWSEVANTMLSAKLGPDGLGFAGETFQHMLWNEIATHDFGSVDQGMTAAMLDQLGGPGGAAKGAAPAMRPTADLLPGSSAPAAATPRTSSPEAMSFPTAIAWVKHVWGHLVQAAKALGVPAEGLLAQSALETDWGRHAPGHNLFGVKARGGGESFVASTMEYAGGVLRQTDASFAKYGSAADSAADYVRLVRSAYPQAMGKATVAGFASALQAGGYATDPRYAEKIEAIAHSDRLHSLLSKVQDLAVATNISGAGAL